jgi:hypothetical protein
MVRLVYPTTAFPFLDENPPSNHPKTPVGVLDGWIFPSINTFWTELDNWMDGILRGILRQE